MNAKMKRSNKAPAAPALLADETGKGTVLAMLFCIAVIGAYIKVGRVWLDANVPPFYATILLLMIGVITLFTLGCALHMIFIGDKSGRELRRDLKKQTDQLYSFVAESEKKIHSLEAETIQHAGYIRPSGITSLNSARRIVAAIGRRADEVNKLLASRSKYDLIDAHELLNQPLRIVENAMDSLIGSDPIPPLDPADWFQTVEGLCENIGAELQRVAA
jgi:hypothetical protein